VPEGIDIKQVKSGLEQLDNVTSLNQLNLWTMDGLEKNAIVHLCMKKMEYMETCKESIRIFLKDCGFQNITIEMDADLETHQEHKRKVCDLERNHEHHH